MFPETQKLHACVSILFAPWDCALKVRFLQRAETMIYRWSHSRFFEAPKAKSDNIASAHLDVGLIVVYFRLLSCPWTRGCSRADGRSGVRATRCEEESVERALLIYGLSMNVKIALVNSSEVPCYVPAKSISFRGLLHEQYYYIFLSISRSLSGYCATPRVLDFFIFCGFCKETMRTNRFNHMENLFGVFLRK